MDCDHRRCDVKERCYCELLDAITALIEEIIVNKTDKQQTHNQSLHSDNMPNRLGSSEQASHHAAPAPRLVIRYDQMRLNKPLNEITAADVPRGFDPEDVASDF